MDRLRDRTTGYWGLLNLAVDRHQTVFLSDFDLDPADVARIRRDLHGAPTCLHVHRFAGSPDDIRAALAAKGIDFGRDYVSVQALTLTHAGHDTAHAFFDALPRGDFTRIELPFRELRPAPVHVAHLLSVILCADYEEQDRISDLFFGLLARRVPYEVIVETPGARLAICDTRPWFQLAGRLQQGEQRILPGGEVAYTGGAIEGSIRLDGAILAVPQRPEVAPVAARLNAQSAHLSSEPVTVHIAAGRVTAITGGGPAQALAELLEHDAYRTVSEVGLSFNRACARYIHDWPAASNEGHPGAHIALGGDPEPKGDRPHGPVPIVHVDLMAANAAVTVNGRRFLQTSL